MTRTQNEGFGGIILSLAFFLGFSFQFSTAWAGPIVMSVGVELPISAFCLNDPGDPTKPSQKYEVVKKSIKTFDYDTYRKMVTERGTGCIDLKYAGRPDTPAKALNKYDEFLDQRGRCVEVWRFMLLASKSPVWYAFAWAWCPKPVTL